MTIREQIYQHLHPLLQGDRLNGEHLKGEHQSMFELSVEDESYRHGQVDSHFKVVAVTELFTTMTPLQRHRWMYQQLDSWLKAGVHALALHLYTPKEWDMVTTTDSPLCRGGSKTR